MRMTARTSTSAQLKDLVKRPISSSYEIVRQLGNASQPCKVIASRVMAARAILKAAEGSGVHLEQVLDRTEGKVASADQGQGISIAFNFQLAGPQTPGSVGEVLQGVLAPQAINPTLSSNPTHTPLTLPAQPAEDKDDT